jgi:hypothetical protein
MSVWWPASKCSTMLLQHDALSTVGQRQLQLKRNGLVIHTRFSVVASPGPSENPHGPNLRCALSALPSIPPFNRAGAPKISGRFMASVSITRGYSPVSLCLALFDCASHASEA